MRILLFFTFFAALQVHAVDLDDVLNQIDRLYRADTSFAQVEMQIINPNWKRTLDMDIWTKGMEYTFVVINSPKKDKGIATLKRQNEMWNFFPKINKIMKVPPSMMMSSWMGSDFTNDDLVKENTLREDYNHELTSKEQKTWIVHLTPKKQTVSIWGRIELHANKEPLYPIKQIFFDENGIKIRTMVFSDLKRMDGRLIPVTMELVPHTKEKEGHKTIITYKKMKFNPKTSDDIFTRRNLQKRR